jgi:S-adenosylmethionine:tRNA ribosyltransferase-isomerase
MLSLSDFDYSLPEELIALYPPKDRPSARLLCVERGNGNVSHGHFSDITGSLRKGDLLVLNDTKVIPARLFARKTTGGKVEAFLLRRLEGNRWKVMLRPGKRVRQGMKLSFGENGCVVTAEVADDGGPDSCERVLEFSENLSLDELKKIGHVPLPPYLHRPDESGDREDYQTVFARCEGAVAAPTAGLHFDQALLGALAAQGIETAYVTLHVGYGTFQTIVSEDLSGHRMSEEEFELSEDAAGKINAARRDGRRIIACGTTSVRVLESCAEGDGFVKARKGTTNLFIYPPYRFKIPDGIITNFHLPKSSLILLVAAFLGWDKTREVYEEAIRRRYKFYSYGDAMLIV